MIIGLRTLFITLTFLAAVNAVKLPARIRREHQRKRSKAGKLPVVNIRRFSGNPLGQTFLVQRLQFLQKRKFQ